MSTGIRMGTYGSYYGSTYNSSAYLNLAKMKNLYSTMTKNRKK